MTAQLNTLIPAAGELPTATLYEGGVSIRFGPQTHPYILIEHPEYLTEFIRVAQVVQAAWAIQRDEPVPFEPTLTAVPEVRRG